MQRQINSSCTSPKHIVYTEPASSYTFPVPYCCLPTVSFLPYILCSYLCPYGVAHYIHKRPQKDSRKAGLLHLKSLFPHQPDTSDTSVFYFTPITRILTVAQAQHFVEVALLN